MNANTHVHLAARLQPKQLLRLSVFVLASQGALGCRKSVAPTKSPAQARMAEPAPKDQDPCAQLWQRIWEAETAMQGGAKQSKAQLRSRAKSIATCRDDQGVSFAMAQALAWGRVAQGRGLGGLSAFRRAAKWGELAYARDPEFKSGMPRRVLGSMWALGGQHLRGKDSEEGLELLFEQFKRYPQDPINVLRVSEALVTLGDLEGAQEVYCAYNALPQKPWAGLHQEAQGLRAQLSEQFEAEGLGCAPSTSDSGAK